MWFVVDPPGMVTQSLTLPGSVASMALWGMKGSVVLTYRFILNFFPHHCDCKKKKKKKGKSLPLCILRVHIKLLAATFSQKSAEI